MTFHDTDWLGIRFWWLVIILKQMGSLTNPLYLNNQPVERCSNEKGEGVASGISQEYNIDEYTMYV